MSARAEQFADAFAAVCSYHTSIQTAVQHLRFIAFMQPTITEGSVFRADAGALKAMIDELVRIQRASGIRDAAAADGADSWSDGASH